MKSALLPEESPTPRIEQSPARRRILVADDHPVIRIGVRNMLAAVPGYEVVGEACDGEEAVAQAHALVPDIVLLDLKMPRLPGIETLRTIMRDSVPVKTILLTGSISMQEIVEALQIGARGIVTKDVLVDHLFDALAAVLEGDYWVGGRRVLNLMSTLSELMQHVSADHRTYDLTRREQQVVQHIVEGCTNRDIASELGTSPEKIKRHLSNIYDKTGVSTRLELALFAISRRLVEF
jgi:two-component system nitrate/nitrite response regulator NarL